MPDGNTNSPDFENRKFQAIPLNPPEGRLEKLSRTRLVPVGLAMLATIGVVKGIQTADPIWNHDKSGNDAGAIEQFHQNPWADRVRVQIETKTPAEGNKLRKDLMITEGDEPAVEYIDGKAVLTDTIEVFIGIPSPFDPDGNITDVGRIELGTELDEVLMVDGIDIGYAPGSTNGPEPLRARYGAFEAGDLNIIGFDHKPLDLNPNAILTVKADNLAKIDQPQESKP